MYPNRVGDKKCKSMQCTVKANVRDRIQRKVIASASSYVAERGGGRRKEEKGRRTRRATAPRSLANQCTTTNQQEQEVRRMPSRITATMANGNMGQIQTQKGTQNQNAEETCTGSKDCAALAVGGRVGLAWRAWVKSKLFHEIV